MQIFIKFVKIHRGKSFAHREHMITTSCFSNDDDNVSLDGDQEEVPKSTHDAASSSAVQQGRRFVLSQQDPFTCKYETHWKNDISM